MRQRSMLILAAFTILIASCGNKGGKSGLLVPKDASMVVHVNSSSLSSKISWDEIRQTNWFREISTEAKDTLAKQLLADPTSSGVDISKDLIFYLRKQGRGAYAVFEGSLSDAAAYEKMLQEMNKEQPKEIKKDGEFTYMEAGKNSIVIWNKDLFALISNADSPDMSGMNQRGDRDRPSFEFSIDSLRMYGKQALTLSKEDNLDADERFADLVKDGSDMHMWINAEELYKGANAQMSMMNMMKFSVLFEDNVTAVSMNFDNGKITAKSKTFYGDEMSRLLAKHKAEPIKADLINRIPSQNVAAVFAFNYPPQGLQEFLKVLGVDGIANTFLAQVNFSVEEFVKANKGEMLFAITDLEIKTATDSIIAGNEDGRSRMSPDMKFIFATAVNDRASFDKLVGLAGESTKGLSEKMPGISYKIENNWFAASNSPEQLNAFLAGGKNEHSFTSKITGHPAAGYLDLQKMINLSTSFIGKDSSAMIAKDASLKMWQDVVAYGGAYKDKAIHFEIEVNLVDKSTNSLKQLNQYIDKLSTIKKKKNDDLHAWGGGTDEIRLDSTAVAPAESK